MNELVIIGMVLALGLIVDVFILMMEGLHTAIFIEKLPFNRAAINTLSKYAIPAAAGQLTTILALAPLMAISGLAGKFIRIMPLTTIICLTMAFFVAILLSVPLSRFLLSKITATKSQETIVDKLTKKAVDKFKVFLANTFLKGLLRPVLAETVNYVNAPLMAKNRGIEIAEQKSASVQDYANQVTVIVETQKGTHWVAGTVLANSQPKIVRLDGYSIDAAPSGNMLVVPHIDRPNIIGPVGVLLGEGKINIAAMQVGRQEIGGPAVMVLNIDNAVPEDILDKLLQIDGVTDVKYIQL